MIGCNTARELATKNQAFPDAHFFGWEFNAILDGGTVLVAEPLRGVDENGD